MVLFARKLLFQHLILFPAEMGLDSVNSTLLPATNHTALENNTETFLIGFGILFLFVLAGVSASVFLCITLKKDPYLWSVDRERSGRGKRGLADAKNEQTVVDESVHIWLCGNHINDVHYSLIAYKCIYFWREMQ